jgi:type I restriction enzyme S subunit
MANRWISEPLAEVADIIMGQSPPSSTYNDEGNGLPFFQGKAEFGEIFPVTVKYCSKPLRIAEPNDILMTVRAPVGPVNLGRSKCCIGRGLCAIRGKKQKMDQMYLFYYLRSIESKLSKRGQGSTFGAIGRRDLERIEVPHPIGLNTQRRIASIVQKAHGLKQRREQANQLTNNIIQSVFLKMFGNKKFTREPIGKHVIKTEVRDPRKRHEEYFKYIDIAGIDNKTGKIVEVKTVLGKEAPSRARRVVRKDDVIVSTVRPNLNATALVPLELDNQICSTGFCVLRCKSSLNSRYLYVFTRRREFIDMLSSQMKGASYPAVTNNDVLNVEIPIPSINLQNKFALIVERIEALKDRQGQSTKEITELFHSLMRRAFRGELVAGKEDYDPS